MGVSAPCQDQCPRISDDYHTFKIIPDISFTFKYSEVPFYTNSTVPVIYLESNHILRFILFAPLILLLH